MNLGGLLAGLGGGVTQAMQNYQQQRDAQMRNMLLQLYMAQQQRQSQANKALGGLDLGSLGGDDKGIAGLAGIGGGPPAITAAPTSAPGPSAGGGGMAATVQPPPIPEAPEGTPARTGMTVTAPLGEGGFRGVEALIPSAPEPLAPTVQPPPVPDAPEAASPPAAAAGKPGDSAPAPALAAAAGEPGGGGLVAHLPGGGEVPIERLMGHRVGLAEVQKLIRTQRPDLDPEAAWMATESLFKLVNQDNSQQRMFGLGVLKELGVISGLGLRQQQVASTIQHQRATEGQADKRIQQGNTRIDMAREALVERKANVVMNKANAGIRAQVQQLMDRRRTILEKTRSDPLHQASEEDVVELQKLDKQIEDMHGKLAGNAGAAPLPGR